MDQFECRRLVDGVSVGPVDANLEGFLDGGGTMRGNQMENQEENESEVKPFSVTSNYIYY